MDKIQENLLAEIAGLHEIPTGAYNIRANGEGAGRRSTEHIQIETKQDKPGIDIHIADGTKRESVHIPVIISETGLTESVYNDFFIGKDCDVTIIAGCGIHNCGTQKSEHDGIILRSGTLKNTTAKVTETARSYLIPRLSCILRQAAT